MGKYITIAILALIIIVVSAQTIKLFGKERDLSSQLRMSGEKMELIGRENKELQAQIEYFSHKENLEKELRAKFNYKKPEEHTMIITP